MKTKKKEKIEVHFYSSFAGRVIAEVIIGNEHVNGVSYKENEGKSIGITYRFDIDYLKEYPVNQLEEKGYTTGINNMQLYPRITINK